MTATAILPLWQVARRIARQSASRLLGDTRGGTALEFALLAPVFFLLIFGILEIAIVVWFSSLLDNGAYLAGKYLRDQAMLRQAPSHAEIRNTICSAISPGGMRCERLKIGLYVADNPVARPMAVPTIIVDTTPALTARSFVIAVGYDWELALPTTQLLLVTSGDSVQLQARNFVSIAERTIR